MIIADPFLQKNGLIQRITQPLQQEQNQIELFTEIIPDPPIETVVAGIEVLEKNKPEVLIAVGGGSAIDTAKAMLYFAQKTQKIGNPVFVAIPTTSGTGSEVTNFSVITDRQKGTKYPLVADEMLPNIAILSTELVKALPQKIIADTGMDVLTHALEAMVSTKANEFSDALAEKAAALVFSYLSQSYQESENLTAKKQMHIASCLAGLAFNQTSLGVNHSIAHVLGAKFHIPHGRANAILLPHVISFNANITGFSRSDYHPCAEKYAAFARQMGWGSATVKTSVQNLIQRIKRLQKQLHLPGNLQDCGIPQQDYEKELSATAELVLQDGCLATNPRKVNKADILALLKDVYC